MDATNKAKVRSAISGYWNEILGEVEKQCHNYCNTLCIEAVKARQTNPNAHNFTGNLLNSIVVCLYRQGRPIAAYYAARYAAEAIQMKMRKRKRRRYFFNPDYDGANSAYLPTIQTNGGWGVDDARDFFFEYKPRGGNLFDIVVAYPVEYANWVESQRQSTGILQTYQNAENVGISFLKVA